MDAYTFSLVLGGVGLVAMAATGLAHSGGHEGGHVTGHGSSGHAGDGSHMDHAGALHTAGRTSAHHAGGFKSALLSLASPRTLFSLLVGFGLTGVVVRPFIAGGILLALALLGGILFELAFVAPLWRLLFRFASKPAATLEGSLLGEARAASGFDANGQGLIAIEVDGQIVQCLGTLQPDDFALGVRVRAGDLLRVEDVEPGRNRCTVSFVGHGTSS
jgi:hypothetical protein